MLYASERLKNAKAEWLGQSQLNPPSKKDSVRHFYLSRQSSIAFSSGPDVDGMQNDWRLRRASFCLLFSMIPGSLAEYPP